MSTRRRLTAQKEQENLTEAAKKLMETVEALRERIGHQRQDRPASADDMVVAYHRFRGACRTFDTLSREFVDRWL